jgi:hypothetical protein
MNWLDQLEAADPAYNGTGWDNIPACAQCGSLLVNDVCVKRKCPEPLARIQESPRRH